MKGRRLALIAAVAGLLTAPAAHADGASEAATAALFDTLLDSPPLLRMFLTAMPKGGDLHNHLTGAPYAEDFLQWAAQADLCVDAAGTAIAPPPCASDRKISGLGERDPFAFARLVDGLSTRGVQRGVGANDASGHTQFFGSFARFGAISGTAVAQSLVAARRMAAGDHVAYLELDHNPPALIAHTLAAEDVPLDVAGLPAAYARESAAVDRILTTGIAEMDAHETAARATLKCGTAAADPACAVAVHYLAWGWRDLPPAQVFRSLVLAFALADRDPRYVGINIVQPEDWPIARRDYDLHMAMIRFLGQRYPRVRRTLHAGELAFGLVPPADLRDHIAKALDAGAQRIGHGTAIAYEAQAPATLRRMARDGIAVEINLTSNAVILGVKGADHPLALYRRMGVPVVLSTDDEGILRTDMTQEYLRAAREQGLRYPDLKALARASLTYAFLPEDEKAGLQKTLETQFDHFEQSIGDQLKPTARPMPAG